MRYLAIDFGSKKIGLAVGDSELNIALPYKVLDNNDSLFKQIAEIINLEKIDKLVIGLPKLAATNTKQEQANNEFAQKIGLEIKLPYILVDESFTSLEAQKRLSNLKNKDDHAVAAMLFLQSFLETK